MNNIPTAPGTGDGKRVERIAFILHDNTCGGAERVAVNLVNTWAEQGRQIAVLTFTRNSFYALHPAVEQVYIHCRNGKGGRLARFLENARMILGLRRELKRFRPQTVVCFLTFFNQRAVLASVGMPWRLILSERNNPAVQLVAHGRKTEQRLMPVLYPRADLLVVQNAGVAAQVAAFMPPQKVMTITNPVMEREEYLSPEVAALTDSAILREYDFVAVGRLDKQKGYERLLAAFAGVVKEEPAATLVILGEGKDRAEYEQLAETLGIAKNVRMPGHVQKPGDLVLRSRIFVMTSHYEGMPNAMLEAMVLGRPVISYDFDFGPAELLAGGQCGVLVRNGDVPELTLQMLALLRDPARQNALKESALASVRRYALPAILRQWDGALQRCDS